MGLKDFETHPERARWSKLARRQFLLTAASALATGEFLSTSEANPLSAFADAAQEARRAALADALSSTPGCGDATIEEASARELSSKLKPDFRLSIEPVSLEIAPGRVIKTTGYSGRVPGPLIRVKENQRVTIAVENKTPRADIVHWHGLQIPSDEDGAMEEGSPMIEAGSSFVYSFDAKPSGTRWYHSHAMAGPDLTKALYTGEYGFFCIDPAREPGAYDQEIFLALHHWEPAWVNLQDTIKGVPPNNGLEIAYTSASINDKALGHGEPIRVRFRQRVLFRLLNASATQDVALALPGHQFMILALDGNPIPAPKMVDAIFLAPAERVDAVIQMNFPGVWVLGSLNDAERASGMGIVIEYAGAKGAPIWLPHPIRMFWDYTQFTHGGAPPAPDERIELVFQKILGGRGKHNYWTINGKSWPNADPIRVEQGKRYRIMMRNLSFDMHPIHTHRHSFEVTNYMGKATSGLIKDVVALPGQHSGEIDFVANNPGPSLFHCHMQDHQDFGFMALIEYS